MGEIWASIEQIRRAANDLASMNKQFKRLVEELQSEEQVLESMWEGDARNAFHVAFARDCIRFDQFASAIAGFCRVLLNIAQNYEDADRNGASVSMTTGPIKIPVITSQIKIPVITSYVYAGPNPSVPSSILTDVVSFPISINTALAYRAPVYNLKDTISNLDQEVLKSIWSHAPSEKGDL